MFAFNSGLRSLDIRCRDGQIGSVDDLLFDEQKLDVRWIVVDTGSWLLPGRLVLIPPSHLQGADSRRSLHVNLTRKQVEDSPPIQRHQPVSRQMEASIYGSYNWIPYWYTPTLVGPPAAPYAIAPPREMNRPNDSPRNEGEDATLRSAGEIIGYYIEGRDEGAACLGQT